MNLQAPPWLAGFGYSEVRRRELRKSRMMMVVGTALSEAMISGNVARTLRDLRAVSRERIDTSATLPPWLQVGGLHFS